MRKWFNHGNQVTLARASATSIWLDMANHFAPGGLIIDLSEWEKIDHSAALE
ncbi:hypothetical protein Brsp01_45600 [Brucella sp. NBRC 12950]|jgi:hypothetical protein|nr:hypothetical protein Brsp01_45600 [Brucella sp. NBRC 12950]